MKKKVFAFILSAVLVLSMAGCSSGETVDNSNSSATGQETSQQTANLMDKDTYLEKVDGLNQGALDFVNAVSSFEDDNMEETISAIRDSKGTFVEFSEIDNPPEGYEDLHTKMAQSCGEMADLIEQYADFFQSAWDGETELDDEKLNTLLDDINATIEDIGITMGEIQEL